MKNTRFFLSAVAVSAALIYTSAAHAQAYSGPETATSITPTYSSTTRTECRAAGVMPGWLGKSLGAVLGAAAGSEVGKGKGNAIATASGAVLGAQAGEAMTSGSAATQTCVQVIDKTLTGYEVAGRKSRLFVPLEMIQTFTP